jgi:hypothetical protein
MRGSFSFLKEILSRKLEVAVPHGLSLHLVSTKPLWYLLDDGQMHDGEYVGYDLNDLGSDKIAPAHIARVSNTKAVGGVHGRALKWRN